MRIAVQCQSIVPGRSAGVEHFAYGVLNGLKSVLADGDDCIVCIPNGTRLAWEEHVQSSEAMRLVEARSTATFGVPMDVSTPLARHSAFLRTRFGKSGPARTTIRTYRRWHETRSLRQIAPAVVYYPFHRVDAFGHPSVITVHDLRVTQPEFFDPLEARRLERNLRRASAIVSSWAHPYAQVREQFPDLRDRMHLIPIPPLNTRLLNHPLPEVEPDLLLYASSTAIHKNHLALIEAIARVRAVRPIRLLCTGPMVNPGYARAQKLVRRLGLSDAVKFSGFLSDYELAQAYARAAAIVAPTLWEAASGTVYEAVYYGKPVACSDIPPLRAQAAECGAKVRFFNPTSAEDIAAGIIEILERGHEYARDSRNATGIVRARTWANTGSAYLDVFRAVAERQVAAA